MKKIIVLMLALAFCLSACAAPADGNEESKIKNESGEENTSEESSEESSAEETSSEETSSEESSAEESSSEESSEEEKPGVEDLGDLSPYIKLGAWKGINVAEKIEVTDERLEKILNEKYLAKYATLEDTGAAAKEGDTVVMDYKGYFVDTNEAFEGGEAKDANLLLGSNQYVDGFESGIIGHSAGESFDIYLTFPENYHESLANKDVRFAITLKKVQQTVYPTPDEKILKELGFETVEKLNEKVAEEAKQAVYTENMTNVWAAVLKDAEVIKYPEEQHQDHYDYFVDYYEGMYKYYATYYGMEFADYLKAALDMTEEEFRADLAKNAKEYADGAIKEELTAYAVADAAFNRQISDEEYDTFLKKYANDQGTTVEELTKKYSREALIENMLWDKVMVYLYDNAVFGAQTE